MIILFIRRFPNGVILISPNIFPYLREGAGITLPGGKQWRSPLSPYRCPWIRATPPLIPVHFHVSSALRYLIVRSDQQQPAPPKTNQSSQENVCRNILLKPVNRSTQPTWSNDTQKIATTTVVRMQTAIISTHSTHRCKAHLVVLGTDYSAFVESTSSVIFRTKFLFL